MESLNDLILIASTILDNGFDLQTFLEWKRVASALLLGILGPSHYYTLSFSRFSEASSIGLLAGMGILEAARQPFGIKPEEPAQLKDAALENGCPAVQPLELSSRRKF
jgi:hypothetical protein